MVKVKSKFKWWIYVFIMIAFTMLFLILRFVLVSSIQSQQKNEFIVNPLDEQVIYRGAAYDVADQSIFLPEIKPFK